MAKPTLCTVTGRAAEFYGGALYLTEAQAATRSTRLVRLDHGRGTKLGKYEVVRGPVQFKHGEVVGLDGEIPTSLAHVLEDVEAAEKRSAAEARARAEAAEQERARAADAARNAQQHTELLAAMAGLQGDSNGNIGADRLAQHVAGKVNFQPTQAQLEAAWAAHVAPK